MLEWFNNFNFVLLISFTKNMKKALLIGLSIFILIQLIRPKMNIDNSNSLIDKNVTEFPVDINKVLVNSCFDCHSNNTKYPWYNQLAPFSWIIAQHINEGKEHLNFSKWNTYNTNQKNHLLDEIEAVIKENKMPLKSYLLMHDVALKKEEKELVLNWVQQTKSRLKNE